MNGLAGEFVNATLVARLRAATHPGVATVTRKDVFEHYGLSHDAAQALLLIRPDGIIAWRGDNDDFSPLAVFLERFSSAAAVPRL